MDKKLRRKLKNIWFNLKMSWLFKYWEWQRRWHSRKCKKGWHLLRAQKIKLTTYKNGKSKVLYDDTFLKCAYCDWLFFPTKEQKEAYEKYKRREHKQNQRWIKAMANPKIKTTQVVGEKNDSRQNTKRK